MEPYLGLRQAAGTHQASVFPLATQDCFLAQGHSTKEQPWGALTPPATPSQCSHRESSAQAPSPARHRSTKPRPGKVTPTPAALPGGHGHPVPGWLPQLWSLFLFSSLRISRRGKKMIHLKSEVMETGETAKKEGALSLVDSLPRRRWARPQTPCLSLPMGAGARVTGALSCSFPGTSAESRVGSGARPPACT